MPTRARPKSPRNRQRLVAPSVRSDETGQRRDGSKAPSAKGKASPKATKRKAAAAAAAAAAAKKLKGEKDETPKAPKLGAADPAAPKGKRGGFRRGAGRPKGALGK